MAPGPILIVLLALIAIPVGIVAVIYLIVPVFKAIGWLIRQVFRFVFGEIGDCLRIVGALIAQLFFLPLIIGNVLIGRWSASAHYGRALSAEFKTLVACLYRMAIGHPARLFCLNAVVDGIEKRVPDAIAAAPGPDRPSKARTGQFDGYTIVGSLPGGGSGGKLYIANPDAIRLAGFARAGQPDVRQVVIKTFSLKDGSSLPQIVRESRALEAAKKLGLVLDHELGDDRFYYVMKYVPGESLGLVTQRLHAMAGNDGLETGQMRQALAYSADLLRTLDQYHRGGLWHKDVKPDNIIVDGRSAHLVDFGLVTPLRSGMTLTTHGTEYFRDPEMVRMALKGVKVHQVDGAKFDVYAAGAVLFSMIENSFPAHGGLSQISKRCPEALRWVVRRAMTEYDKRYPSAATMLADLEVIRSAPDPYAVRPVELPSMRGAMMDAPAYDDEAPIRPQPVPVAVGSGSDIPGAPPPPLPPLPPLPQQARAGSPVPPPFGAPMPRSRPKIKVNRWWTGGYEAEQANVQPAGFAPAGFGAAAANRNARGPRASARDQLEAAQSRARAARERAQERMSQRRSPAGSDFHVFNPGVVGAIAVFLVAAFALAALMFTIRRPNIHIVTTDKPGGTSFAMVDLPKIENFPSPPAPPEIPSAAVSGNGIVMQKISVPGPRVVVNGAAVSAVGSPDSAVQGHRVLIISDIQPPSTLVSGAIDRLQAVGFSLLGNIPGSHLDESERQEQEQLEAAAKVVRGLSTLDAVDVKTNLSHWLAEEDLDLLVWFTRADDQGREKCVIITPALDENPSTVEVNTRQHDMTVARLSVGAGAR